MSDETSAGEMSAKRAVFMLAWVVAGSAMHLLLWFVLLGYFYFRIPRQRKLYADFGVELSDTAVLVIRWANVTLTYWYLTLPMLFISVVIMNSTIAALLRSRRWRLVLMVLLAIPPLAWLLNCHLVLQSPLDRIMQELQ